MLPIRCAFVAVFLISAFAPFSGAQEEGAFPSDNEIQLLATQAERAVVQYKSLLDDEASQLGKDGAAAVARDRQVVDALEAGIKALNKQPQRFNGHLGFAFFEWLDDASRNALLCSSTAMNQLSERMLAGTSEKGIEFVHLSQGCMDASTLLYTVSENAGSLYARYVRAEQALAEEGFKVAQRCTNLLKQQTETKKQ